MEAIIKRKKVKLKFSKNKMFLVRMKKSYRIKGYVTRMSQHGIITDPQNFFEKCRKSYFLTLKRI